MKFAVTTTLILNLTMSLCILLPRRVQNLNLLLDWCLYSNFVNNFTEYFVKKNYYFWLGMLRGFNLEWVQGCANAGGNMGKTTRTYARYMKLSFCSLLYFGFFINLFLFIYLFSISNIKTSLTLCPVHRECTKKAKTSRNQTTMINQHK